MDTPGLGQAYFEETYSVGSRGNVIVVHWRSRPTLSAVLRIREVIDRVLETQPGGIGFLAIADTEVSAPDGETRDEFARVMRERADRILGSAMVIDGTGLKAAAARVVVAAITLLGDLNPVPQVCATIDDAATTLVRLLREAPEPALTAAEIAATARLVRGLGR